MMGTLLMRRARASILVGLLVAGCVPDADNVVADSAGTSSGGAAADTSSGSTIPDALDTTTDGSTTEGATGDPTSSDDGGSSTGEAPPSTPFVDACVDGVNLFRAMEGLSLLTRWTEGEACAMQVAMDDAAVGDPFGSIPRGSTSLCGEAHHQFCGTVAGAWEDPVQQIADCAELYFSDGPQGGNYQSMMDPANTQVACGWAETSNGSFFAYHLFR
jgi:hypothetical protein